MGVQPRNRSALLLATTLVIAVVAGLTVRHLFAAHSLGASVTPRASTQAAAGPETVLRVPHTPGAITLDGDTDDPGWISAPGPARTGDFLMADGTPARPFSEVRLVWGDGYLYLALYAADEDIETRTAERDGPLWLDDEFRVVFSREGVEYAIEVSPKAVITDSMRVGDGKWDHTWNSGAHASVEIDGTVNDPMNIDEEWAIEMAVPFESLGMKGEPGESVGMSVTRCDTPKRSARVCTGWGEGDARGRLVLK